MLYCDTHFLSVRRTNGVRSFASNMTSVSGSASFRFFFELILCIILLLTLKLGFCYFTGQFINFDLLRILYLAFLIHLAPKVSIKNETRLSVLHNEFFSEYLCSHNHTSDSLLYLQDRFHISRICHMRDSVSCRTPRTASYT